MIYAAILTLHIIGIVLFAGTTFIDFFLSRQFWKIYVTDPNSAETINDIITKVQQVAAWGGRFILLSGIIMICIHRLWLAQTWFQVKMVILLIVLVNGTLRQKVGRSLYPLMVTNASSVTVLKIKLTRMQLLQLLLLTIMFTLSVFKFN